MAHSIKEQLQERFDADLSARRMEAMLRENELALRQAKYHAREAKVAWVEYENSSLRFLNRFSERRRDRGIALEQEVKRTQTALDELTRQRERLELEAEQIRLRMDQLPEWEALKSVALENPETAAEFWRLEALSYIAALQPVLEQNHTDLTEHYRYLRGEYAGRVMSVEESAVIQTTSGVSGKVCADWLARLREALDGMGISMEAWSYFDNPVGYIVSAAARHNQVARAREAVDQNEAVQRFVRDWKVKLED